MRGMRGESGRDSEGRERSNIVDSKHDFFILILIIKETGGPTVLLAFGTKDNRTIINLEFKIHRTRLNF